MRNEGYLSELCDGWVDAVASCRTSTGCPSFSVRDSCSAQDAAGPRSRAPVMNWAGGLEAGPNRAVWGGLVVTVLWSGSVTAPTTEVDDEVIQGEGVIDGGS